jgi:Na+-driven multidrug efflux pump
MFLALGNTLPVVLGATARFVVFSVPALWLSYQAGFHDEQIWYMFTVSILVQAIGSLWLLQAEFKRKLQLPVGGTGPAVVSKHQTIEG